MSNTADPHRGEPVLQAGAALPQATAAMIMLHGRGADAADIIALSRIIGEDGIAYRAPEAADHSWYPYSFLAPLAHNEPGRTSALGVIAALIEALGRDGRIGSDKIALLGFSQGACLALEFAARHPRRYGGIFALSGGLIGEEISRQDYAGSLDGTPVFLGCSDVDPHIPVARVRQSAQIMQDLGGDVTERIYPGMGHTVVEDEILHVRRTVAAMTGESGG